MPRSRRDDKSMRGHRRGGATTRWGPSRPNPLGGGELRAISLSFVVDDALASTPPLFATSPRKTPPQTLSYLCKGVLAKKNNGIEAYRTALFITTSIILTEFTPEKV